MGRNLGERRICMCVRVFDGGIGTRSRRIIDNGIQNVIATKVSVF